MSEKAVRPPDRELGGELGERDQLICDHLPLLHYIVGKLALDVPGSLDRDDLAGYGMIGLIGAADSWDPSRGLKFSTFAYSRIRGAILDELRRLDFLPRGRRERVREVDRVVAELEQATGMPPTPEEIATALDVSPDEVDDVLLHARSAHVVSLEEGPTELGALLGDPRSDDPEGSVAWEEMKAFLAASIQELPEQERSVVTLYYGEDLLLKEIAEVMDLTESRISQIHTRALYRLNRALRVAAGEEEAA